jgi:tol-pal system protein YbgF
MKRPSLLLLLAALPLAAQAGLFTDDEAHAKIEALKKESLALEGRIATIETTVKSQALVDLLSQIEQLKQEIAKLRGQIEVSSHDIENTQKRQKDLYVDLDARLRKLERGGATAPAATEPPPAKADGKPEPKPASAGPAAAPAAGNPAEEAKAYELALNQFKIGNYPGAIAGFQAFTRNHPSSPLASSAQYWVGNSYFNLRDYKSAIGAQQQLIKQFPTSPKVPDAMLNIATCMQDMGDAAGARKTLEELVARHPLSDAADKAKKRLAGKP